MKKTGDKLKEITEKFISMTKSTFGLMVSFEGVGWGDGDCLWMEIELGEKASEPIRSLVENSLAQYLTDWRFTAHLTLYRGAVGEEGEIQSIFQIYRSTWRWLP